MQIPTASMAVTNPPGPAAAPEGGTAVLLGAARGWGPGQLLGSAASTAAPEARPAHDLG